MNIDIRITGELSLEKASQLQTALAAFTRPGEGDKPPPFLGVDGVYVEHMGSQVGAIMFNASLELKNS